MSEKRKGDDLLAEGRNKFARVDGGDAFGGDGDVERSPEEFLQLYQKEAMWRQLQAYKRDCLSATETAREAQHARERTDFQLGLLIKSLINLHEEVRNTMTNLNANQGVKPSPNARGKDPLAKLLDGLDSADYDQNIKDVVKQSQSLLHDLRNAVQAGMATWDSWLSKIQAISSADERQNEVVKVYEREVARLAAEREANRDIVEELQNQCQVSGQEVSSLKLELNRARKTASELDQKLATARNQLAAAEKKLDRLKCETTVAVPGVKETVKQEPTSADVKMEEDPAGLMRLKMELAAATAQAESRMKAIQQLEQDKKRLQEELQENLAKPRAGGDDKPDPEKNFHAQITLAKNEMNEAKASAERLSKEIEELRAGGLKLRKQIETEEATRRKTLEAEIRRLESDVNRIRAGRDQVQQLLEVRDSKDKAELIQNHEIRVIANTRKDRIVALEMENQRLRMKIGAVSGSREMVDLFNELAGEDAISELQSRYKSTQVQVEKLMELAASIGATSQQLEEIAAIAPRGAGRPSTSESSHEQSKEEQIKLLELRCDHYEKTEKRLSEEIDTIAKAWTQLEDQNSRKVLDLTGKEEEIIKCHTERTKLEAKLGTMMKQHSTLNNSVLALKKQSDKQLEQIRKLEELQKALSQQITHLEREISARQGMIDGHKRKNADLVLQLNEARDNLGKANARVNEVFNTVKDKTAALENEIRARRQAEELSAQVTKKLEVAKMDPSGDAETARQLEEYRHLLKCPTCNNRFKSHVLLKCMHPFCKQCIDTVYESRQRKCPTCGVPFGQSDIRQVYL